MQHRKKFATPYVFLQLLKLGTSNLVHKLGLGLATKNNVSDQNWRGSEHPKKIWDPLHIFATVEAGNFKFGTQIWFGTSLPKNDVSDQNWQGSGPGIIRKNLGLPIYFCNR